MNRLSTILLVAALTGAATLAACASKPVTATAEDGTLIDATTSTKLERGKTTEAEVKAIVGAEPQGVAVGEDGRTVWVYAWSRATADQDGNVHALEVRELTIWLEEGVVDDFKYKESRQ